MTTERPITVQLHGLKERRMQRSTVTTRKVPAEVFKGERDYLKPIPIVENLTGSSVRRTVRKDNTIVYGSNTLFLLKEPLVEQFEFVPDCAI